MGAQHMEASYLRRRIAARAVVQPNGCWNWPGATNNQGYGQMRVENRTKSAHRVSFAAYVRPLLAGEQVLHRCDNPKCVNPKHLFVGDPASNSADKVAKGRHAQGAALPHTKLTDAQVAAIRAATGTQAEIAARFGIAQSNVSRIKSGERRPARLDVLESEAA